MSGVLSSNRHSAPARTLPNQIATLGAIYLEHLGADANRRSSSSRLQPNDVECVLGTVSLDSVIERQLNQPMNPSEGEIFEQALQLPNPAERAAYLKEAIGDNEPLRQRIETLLRASEKGGGFMDEPPAGISAKTILVTAGATLIAEKPGDKIGRYKLREQIGEGGCGVVYVAEQEEPVRRRVALKVIKLGMDTRSVIARFEAERQALALMDHPHIAKVFDAGATDTGRPFFVMELVRGIKITEYCDQNNLSTAERLKLFIQVCSAIQHAHQKGIIHRDIKPSNVLVTLHDGVPVPKVIDFGIAKATNDQRLTDKTVYTAFEQFLGTPAYMSPEQAEMSGLDIDTRSDIYALGVLLYELLTGNPPFDSKTLLQAGLDQMRRIIREQEPQRPSTRLSTLADADLTVVAKQRHAEPAKLTSLIRGDLDWIVMKALEKDRTRRFETVNALALDVKRHLDNEPVVACPPSSLYRLQKLVRRNRSAFATVTVVTVMLIVGVYLALSLSRKENQSRQKAIAAEETQNKLRLEAKALSLTDRAKRLGDTGDPDELKGASSLLREALAIRRKLLGNEHMEVASSLDNLVEHGQLTEGESEECYREALAIRRKLLGKNHPDTVRSMENLARMLRLQNKWSEAESLYREILAMRRKNDAYYKPNDHVAHYNLLDSIEQVAVTLNKQGRLPEAEALSREALALTKNWPYRNPGDLSLRITNLVDLLRRQGRLDEAKTLYNDVLNDQREEYGNWDLSVASSLRTLAGLLREENKSNEANVAYQEALAIEEKQLRDGNPKVISHLEGLASEFAHENKYEEGERVFSELLARFTGDNANSIKLLNARVEFYAERGHWKEAAEGFVKLIELNPHETWFWCHLAPLLIEVGDLDGYRKHSEAMMAQFSETNGVDFAGRTAKACLLPPVTGKNLINVVKLADKIATHDKNPLFDQWAYSSKALAEYRQGRFAEAVEWANKALNEPDVNFPECKVMSHTILAMARYRLNQNSEAHIALAKAVDVRREGVWIDELINRILLREARLLIEGKPATTETTK